MKPFRVTIKLTRWEKIIENGQDRGGRSVPNGTRSGDIDLLVDEEGLAELLGDRALRNKSRKAALAGGLIKAYARNVKDAPEPTDDPGEASFRASQGRHPGPGRAQ